MLGTVHAILNIFCTGVRRDEPSVPRFKPRLPIGLFHTLSRTYHSWFALRALALLRMILTDCPLFRAM